MTAFLTPLTSLAAYQNPSDLLRGAEFDGGARDFSMEFHGGADGTYASAWINGAAEGSSPETVRAKLAATIDIHTDGITMRSRHEVLIADQKAYLRMKEFGGDGIVDTMSLSDELMGKWYVLPLDEAEFLSLPVTDVNATDAMIGGISEQFSSLPSSPEELQRIGTEIIDNIFALQTAPFDGGTAYTLSLKPDFFKHILRIAAEMAGENPDILLLEPGVMELRRNLDDAVSFSMKIDMNTDGKMRFGRFDFSYDKDGVKVNSKGQTAVRSSAVVFDAPQNAEPIDALASLLNATVSDLPTLEEWGLPTTLEEPKTTPSSSTSVRRTPAHSSFIRDERSRPKFGWQDVEVESADCSALPGTALYLQNVRKGLCPSVPDTRPGRGSRRE